MDILLCIEEIHLSGSLSFARCSKSTLYRWARRINEQLAMERCEWRVKANVKEMSLDYAPLD